MWIEAKPTPYDGEPWGFDNGAFVAWKRGRSWNADAYRNRLDRAHGIAAPYLAVAPDIVAAGERSLDFSLGWLEKLPTDWPWYLAVQDQMTPAMVALHISRFAGVFLGGSDVFKAQALKWRVFAHSHGKPFHYARAGVLWKLDHAMEVGSDSLDSAFPLWTKERFAAFVHRTKYGNPQLRMDNAAGY